MGCQTQASRVNTPFYWVIKRRNSSQALLVMIPRVVADIPFNIKKIGRDSLIIRCDNESRGAKKPIVWELKSQGTAAKKSAVASKAMGDRLLHMRGFQVLTILKTFGCGFLRWMPCQLSRDVYSPMTTPFGYYGPTWQANGIVNSSMNFSLWSFRQSQTRTTH